MKNSILTLALVASLSLFAVSCSTDDSALENDANSIELSTSSSITIDNGDKDLPKPPMRN
jgi:hypothetical protein